MNIEPENNSAKEGGRPANNTPKGSEQPKTEQNWEVIKFSISQGNREEGDLPLSFDSPFADFDTFLTLLVPGISSELTRLHEQSTVYVRDFYIELKLAEISPQTRSALSKIVESQDSREQKGDKFTELARTLHEKSELADTNRKYVLNSAILALGANMLFGSTSVLASSIGHPLLFGIYIGSYVLAGRLSRRASDLRGEASRVSALKDFVDPTAINPHINPSAHRHELQGLHPEVKSAAINVLRQNNDRHLVSDQLINISQDCQDKATESSNRTAIRTAISATSLVTVVLLPTSPPVSLALVGITLLTGAKAFKTFLQTQQHKSNTSLVNQIADRVVRYNIMDALPKDEKLNFPIPKDAKNSS